MGHRILLGMESFPSVSETWNLSVATGLRKAGHDVDIFAMWRGNLSLDHIEHATSFRFEPRYGIGASGRGKLGKLSMYGNALRRALATSRTATWRLITDYVVPRVVASQGALVEAASLKGPEEFDVIHGLFGPSGRRAEMLRSSGFYSGALVVTFGGFDVNSIVPRFGSGYYERLFSSADRLIAVSEFIRDRLIAAGAPASKIDVVYYGVDLSRFVFRKPQLATGRSVRFVSVGRLVDCKGIRFAVEALGMLRDAGVPAEYTIVGDGPEMRGLREQVELLGLTDLVRFTGAVSHAEVISYLTASDVLLAPGIVGSDGATEALGGSIIEAHAIGLPVICSDLGGMPEAIVPEVSGYLVPPNDVSALAASMERMVKNQEDWSSMAEKGRAHIAENFSATGFIDRLQSVYTRAMAAYAVSAIK